MKEATEKQVQTPQEIFDAFAASPGVLNGSFKKMHGYGPEEIQKIGIEKYLKVIGWTNELQVDSWMKDRLHIMLCPVCGENFGIWEFHSGMCEDCKDQYYFELIEDFDTAANIDSEDMPTLSARGLFYRDPSFRELFRKRSNFKEDVLESEFLKIICSMKNVNDILLRMRSSMDLSQGGQFLIRKRNLIEFFRKNRVYGKLKMKDDLPEAYEYFKKVSAQNQEGSSIDLRKLSLDLAIKANQYFQNLTTQEEK